MNSFDPEFVPLSLRRAPRRRTYYIGFPSRPSPFSKRLLLMHRLLYAGLLAAVAIIGYLFPPPEAGSDWPVAGADGANSQYSALDAINRSNVHQLEVAWTYHAGDAGERTQIQCNPIVIDGVVYATTPGLKAIALDGATGAERWRFDPFEGAAGAHSLSVNRGVVYWAEGDDRRILYAAGDRLFALDAATGRPVPSFGTGGSVDLRLGLGGDTGELFVVSNTPGVVYEDLLILGTRVSEGPGAAPGHVRAFNVRTGELAWVFHTVPRPGAYGYDTWPTDAYQRIGGANAWSGMSVDPLRGVVYVPTGSASFDFYGGDRAGQNLFANSVLALDARTGLRQWHFQVVHHDIWDRDLPAAPNLVTLERDGRRVEAVAQVTKSGHVFVLDRTTGEPIFPVEERPVPASDMPGEAAWPTQPIPVQPPPFSRQVVTEADLTRRTPEAHAAVLERFRQVRTHEPFAPPSKEGTIIFPGFDGGAEWGGAAWDSTSGLLYVNANEMPWILTMIDVAPVVDGQAVSLGESVYTANCVGCHGVDREGDVTGAFPSLVDIGTRRTPVEVRQVVETGAGRMPGFAHLPVGEKEALVAFLLGLKASDEVDRGARGPAADVPFAHTGYHRWLDPDGYPAVAPPWGTLAAIDLNEGTIAWQVPLGEYPELTAAGHPLTGTENYGGPVVTAGGLVFIAATNDERIRAFDKATGEQLWEAPLPAGGYATPATYMVDGRQYVVVACGGGKMGTEPGDAYVAFALPE